MTSPYKTNLSQPPYFDSFDPTKQWYRYLFKPAVPIQTQELQGLQALLQDQVTKFGTAVYHEGSIVTGCKFNFDQFNLNYVKINDTYTNGSSIQAKTLESYANAYVWNANGLYAQIISTSSGSLTTAPNTNTLYVKYLNAANTLSAFAANDTLTVTNATSNVTIATIQVAVNTAIANVANVTGLAYGMGVGEGVIFHKGTFVYVANQYLIVSPYTNQPDDLSVGFSSVENIITADIDDSLNDNADGSPNYSAPGADRLQIVPYLTVVNTNSITNTSAFYSLVDFINGAAVTIKQKNQLTDLGDYIAERVYDAHGDFVVSPFKLSTTTLDSSNSQSNTYVIMEMGAGHGYVKGYLVDHPAPIPALLRRGTDYTNVSSQQVTANFGYYVDALEYAGTFLSSSGVVQVELHNVAKTAVSSGTLLSTSYSSSTKIGTAYVRGVSFDNQSTYPPNNTYKIYLFNVQMSAGFNFKDVKSLINWSGSAVLGVADVSLTYSVTAGANVAQIQDPYVNGLIYNFGPSALKPDGFGNNASFDYRAKVSTTVQTNGYASVTVGAASGTGTESFALTGTLSGTNEQKYIVVPTAQGLSANLTANVVVTSGGNTVVANGGGTAFLTDYAVGDWIAVYTTATPELKLITSIANNTTLNVASTFATSNSNTRHAAGYPVGYPINFSAKSSRTIINTSNTVGGIQLGLTMQGTFNVDVYFDILRSSTVPSRKTVKKNIYVKIDCSNNSANVVGPWCLGLPDVLSVQGVYIGTGGAYSNSGTNYVNNFVLDTGQRDSHYGLAYLRPIGNFLNNNSTILVQLTHFTHDTSQGVGFFTCNSYPIDSNTANTSAITLQQIPSYTSQKGQVFDLRDCVDFRIRASNTAVSANSVASATINPSSTLTFSGSPYLVSPDTNFTTNLQYYLPRIDRVVMDTYGTMSVLQGVPAAVNPQPPDETAGTMTLGLVTVPPYPSLATPEARSANRYDYAIQIALKQNRRYTMRDIGVLDQRITNVEYYTSLNLLEQAAQTLLVRNASTGQNRFRNGIFVDPFNGFDIANVNDSTFGIAIDSARSEIRPRFKQFRTDLEFDAVNSSNCGLFGELVMLNHTSNNLYITQQYASRYRNCIDGNVYDWVGTMTLTPPGTLDPDLSYAPDVINNLDLAANWIQLGQSAFGTQWGNWVDVSRNVSNNTTTTSNSTTTTTTTQTTTTTTQNRTGTQVDVTTQNTQLNLGTFVTNISLLPYIKPAVIAFAARGLKPSTRVYSFFGNMAMSAYTRPTYANGSYTAISGDKHSGLFNDPLWTDANGEIYGTFYIPPNTFKSEEIIFQLVDVSDLVQGAYAISTKASATFYGSRLAFSTASSLLNVRNAVLNTNEITEQRTITGTKTNTTIIVNPPTPYTPPYIPYYPDISASGCDSGPGGPGGAASGDGCGCGGGGE